MSFVNCYVIIDPLVKFYSLSSIYTLYLLYVDLIGSAFCRKEESFVSFYGTENLCKPLSIHSVR